MSENQATITGVLPALRIVADVVLLDIEGTISPVSFVRDTLFPYAKKRLRDYVATNRQAPIVQDILLQASTFANGADAVSSLLSWQERDIKAPPLKKLQGLIWESGYLSGELRSPIFPDALQALKRWKADGLSLYIYSSGSVQAQRLFFEFNAEGDLRSLLSGYFDTDVGAKTERSSYLRISERIRAKPDDVVFFSDNVKELQAARSAGLQTVHVVKDDSDRHDGFAEIFDFSEVGIQVRSADRE